MGGNNCGGFSGGCYLVRGGCIGFVIAGFGRNVNVVEFHELKRFRHCFVIFSIQH